jgi:hypothetical protein
MDQGFFPDPECDGVHDPATDITEIQPDSAVPCTVLLGEPGMGKSRELALLRDHTPATSSSRLFDLRGYSDEGRLVTSIFHSPEVTAWINGDGILHLFLDSLDECLVRIDTVASVIADELENLDSHKDRLRLYITCRTAPWPTFLETRLKQFFGEQHFRILEIAPLRRKDVTRCRRIERGFRFGRIRPRDYNQASYSSVSDWKLAPKQLVSDEASGPLSRGMSPTLRGGQPQQTLISPFSAGHQPAICNCGKNCSINSTREQVCNLERATFGDHSGRGRSVAFAGWW